MPATVKHETSRAHHSPTNIVSEIAGEGVTNFIESQKVLFKSWKQTIGRVALRKVSHWVTTRRANAAVLTEAFSKLDGLRTTQPQQEIEHACYKYYAFVRPERLRRDWSRDRIMAAISEKGVPCMSGSCSEIYLEKAFPPEWKHDRCLPVAKELGETSLMFLVHPTLSTSDMEAVADVVTDVMKAATA